MYTVILSKLALKQLEKLEKIVQKRIYAALKRLEVYPERHIKKLVGFPYSRLRIGDYRVILEVHKGELIVLVIKVGHRKNIYRNLS